MEKGGVRNKRALSPIIATVLLIVLVIIIAAIIFLWAKRFIGESIQKQGANIEQKCSEVNLEASKTGTTLYLNNKGNVPIYNVEVKIKKEGSETIETVNANLGVGQANSYEVSGIDEVDSVMVVPSLMGETATSKKEYTCTEIEIEALSE